MAKTTLSGFRHPHSPVYDKNALVYVGPIINYPQRSVKYVRTARAWCTTEYVNPHVGHMGRIVRDQKQVWSQDRPSLKLE